MSTKSDNNGNTKIITIIKTIICLILVIILLFFFNNHIEKKYNKNNLTTFEKYSSYFISLNDNNQKQFSGISGYRVLKKEVDKEIKEYSKDTLVDPVIQNTENINDALEYQKSYVNKLKQFTEIMEMYGRNKKDDNTKFNEDLLYLNKNYEKLKKSFYANAELSTELFSEYNIQKFNSEIKNNASLDELKDLINIFNTHNKNKTSVQNNDVLFIESEFRNFSAEKLNNSYHNDYEKLLLLSTLNVVKNYTSIPDGCYQNSNRIYNHIVYCYNHPDNIYVHNDTIDFSDYNLLNEIKLAQASQFVSKKCNINDLYNRKKLIPNINSVMASYATIYLGADENSYGKNNKTSKTNYIARKIHDNDRCSDLNIDTIEN